LPDENAPWIEIVDGFPKSTTDSRNNAVFPSIADANNQSFKPEEKRPLFQMFLQLAKLSEIIGQILQGLYTTKAKQLSYIQGSDNLVTRLDHELTIWRFGLIKVLQENGTPSGSEPSVTPVAGKNRHTRAWFDPCANHGLGSSLYSSLLLRSIASAS
jgi:hypothetical protein